ncbi:MAG: LOG family protein [Elusimicrobia bacterium]|nr:LOG family protein [Elusimicrobiota bacterium]
MMKLFALLLLSGPWSALWAGPVSKPGARGGQRGARHGLSRALLPRPDRARPAVYETSPQPALPVLQAIAQAAQEPEGRDEAVAEPFDGAWSPTPGIDLALEPKPAGVTHITRAQARSPSDIDRLIPKGLNSVSLRVKLKQALESGRIKQLSIWTYHSSGGSFTGIDLSQDLSLIDILPEQESHEVRLIRKIQKVNPDLRVIVREDGKTPDTELSGMMNELKSQLSPRLNLAPLINKANSQVLAHALRHGLGHGAVSVDLTNEGSVPVEAVLEQLNAWSRLNFGALIPGEPGIPAALKEAVYLDKIWIFAGSEIKMFVRQADDSYRLSEPPVLPLEADRNPLLFSPNGDRPRASVDMRHFASEVENAWRAMRARGVRSLITVYGSARLTPAKRARRAYNDLLAELGPSPSAERDRVALEGALWRSRQGAWANRQARLFGEIVARRAGAHVALMTGGGDDSIMGAASEGAIKAGGKVVAANISLPSEQHGTPWVTPGLSLMFRYISARKIVMIHDSLAHVFFYGGAGTMDEFWEILTQVQTGLIERAPMVLVGPGRIWDLLIEMLEEQARSGLISPEDRQLVRRAPDAEAAWQAVLDFYAKP